MNNRDCQSFYRFSFYFWKVASQITAFLEPGFCEAKFYRDS